MTVLVCHKFMKMPKKWSKLMNRQTLLQDKIDALGA
jgi:hypothetical protein